MKTRIPPSAPPARIPVGKKLKMVWTADGQMVCLAEAIEHIPEEGTFVGIIDLKTRTGFIGRVTVHSCALMRVTYEGKDFLLSHDQNQLLRLIDLPASVTAVATAESLPSPKMKAVRAATARKPSCKRKLPPPGGVHAA